ncbi:hypothetical protein SAMN02910317_01277 [Ruminococcaceae bacterium FB2012]|nr:hypothetical protein SAMN02910317_01277 [Ruminococcaceae bacterium FB2012]
MNIIYKNSNQLYLLGFETLQTEKELKVRDFDGVLVILPTGDFEYENEKYAYFSGLSDPKLKALLIEWLDKRSRSVMVFTELSGVYYLYDPESTDFTLCALTAMCKRSDGKDTVMIRVV